MGQPKKGTAAGIALITTLLVGLYFIPDLIQRKEFQFSAPSHQQEIRFPMTHSLKRIQGPVNKDRVALQEFSKSPKQLYIVNFWATWCPPCIDEFPNLEYLHRQLAALGGNAPKLVTISVDEGTEEVKRLFGTLSFSPTVAILHDPSGEFASKLGTTKFPETYLIDAEGKILHKWVGPQNWLSDSVLSEIKKHSWT